MPNKIFTNKVYCQTLARNDFAFTLAQKLIMLTEAVQQQNEKDLFFTSHSLFKVLKETFEHCLQKPDWYCDTIEMAY